MLLQPRFAERLNAIVDDNMQEPGSDNSSTFLQQIRLYELRKILVIVERFSRPKLRILEIGSGTGWQARELSALGFNVEAIDIPNSNHSTARVWPITDYDGQSIPFPDDSFDIVYSSNVLEHVCAPELLNSEIKRILRKDGVAVHYVPTTAWRIWSLLAFYPALLKDVIRRVFQHSLTTSTATAEIISPYPQRSFVQKLLQRIAPHVHGAQGTFFHEIVFFRKKAWDNYFQQFGWTTSEYSVNGLFLTGDMVLGSILPIPLRQSLSRICGSTAHLYVLRSLSSQDTLTRELTTMSKTLEPILNINYGPYLPASTAAKILDLGCGSGRMLRFFSAHGYGNIVGVDRDARALSQIPDLPGVSVECVEVDAKYLDEHKEEYDLIVLKQMLYYISFDEMQGFVTALRGSLKPDGIVIIEFFNAALLSSRITEVKDPAIRTTFTEHSIRRLLDAGDLRTIEVFGERRPGPQRLRSWIYVLLRAAWVALLKGIYILERGMDDEFPKIYTKSILAIAKRK